MVSKRGGLLWSFVQYLASIQTITVQCESMNNIIGKDSQGNAKEIKGL